MQSDALIMTQSPRYFFREGDNRRKEGGWGKSFGKVCGGVLLFGEGGNTASQTICGSGGRGRVANFIVTFSLTVEE